jgi:hypothetical protein
MAPYYILTTTIVLKAKDASVNIFHSLSSHRPDRPHRPSSILPYQSVPKRSPSHNSPSPDTVIRIISIYPIPWARVFLCTPGVYLKGKMGYKNPCKCMCVKGLERILDENSVTCEIVWWGRSQITAGVLAVFYPGT